MGVSRPPRETMAVRESSGTLLPLQAVQHQLAAEFILVGHAVEGGELLGRSG